MLERPLGRPLPSLPRATGQVPRLRHRGRRALRQGQQPVHVHGPQQAGVSDHLGGDGHEGNGGGRRQASLCPSQQPGPTQGAGKRSGVNIASRFEVVKRLPRAFQIGPECFVGAGTYVSDKTTTKHSTLGSNCKVEEKVRVTNCILMDGVTLKEGCFVSGSLLCDGVIVPERVELKDCIVGKGATIKQGGNSDSRRLSSFASKCIQMVFFFSETQQRNLDGGDGGRPNDGNLTNKYISLND